MGFLETVSPAEMQAGQMLSLSAMIVLMFVGYIPPLRPFAHRIRIAAAGAYILVVFGFIVYVAAFR